MDKRALIRSARTSEDYAIDWESKQEEERKIDEGIALLMEIECRHKKDFSCWTCKEFGHF